VGAAEDMLPRAAGDGRTAGRRWPRWAVPGGAATGGRREQAATGRAVCEDEPSGRREEGSRDGACGWRRHEWRAEEDEAGRDGGRRTEEDRDGQDEAPEGGKNRYYCCSLLLRLDLQKRMGLGLGDAAPRSKTKLPGAAQRRR